MSEKDEKEGRKYIIFTAILTSALAILSSIITAKFLEPEIKIVQQFNSTSLNTPVLEIMRFDKTVDFQLKAVATRNIFLSQVSFTTSLIPNISIKNKSGDLMDICLITESVEEKRGFAPSGTIIRAAFECEGKLAPDVYHLEVTFDLGKHCSLDVSSPRVCNDEAVSIVYSALEI